MKRRRQPGFTLVELLVVVSIIAVLISLLLPALNKARQSGRMIRCLSNLRQMQLASTTYSNDNIQYYLPVYPLFDNQSNSTDTRSWADNPTTRQYLELTPYTTTLLGKAKTDRICPDATYTLSKPNPDGTVNIRYSYGANYTDFMTGNNTDIYLYRTGVTISFVAYRVSKVRCPGDRIAWACALSPSIRAVSSDGYTVDQYPTPNDQIAYRHFGGADIAYFDGHADTQPREKIDISYPFPIDSEQYGLTWAQIDSQLSIWYAIR